MKDMNTQPLKGFRDFLPPAMLMRQKVFETARSVFEKYGFLPMSTPSLEYKEVLSGKYGEEGEKLMYSFKDRGNRDVAMRYDLSVPLARFIAQNQDKITMPFKRYQIDPVWRADKPQKGRYREFYQCDIDVVGSDSMLADSEVIACFDSILEDLGVRDRIVRVNNRKLLTGLMKEAGVDTKKAAEAIRILDKFERIGEKSVRGELATTGIQTKETDKLFELVFQGFESPKDLLQKLKGIEGVGELAQVVEYLLDMGVKNYQIDLTLARGLDYYTGTIFEFIIPDAAEYGSVVGGGRYDELLGMFSKKQIPAVGGSIGVDRLLAVLEELEIIKYDLVSDVLIANIDEALTEKYLQTANALREAGIKTDLYYEPVKLDKQLKYADKKNLNYVVLIGTEEEKKGEAQVKNMATGSQEAMKQKDLVKYLSKKLK